MTVKKISVICLSIALLSGAVLNAQTPTKHEQPTVQESTEPEKGTRQFRPAYLGITTGVNAAKFRDFATSPLFYNGNAIQVSLSRLRKDVRKESELGISYDFGNFTARFAESATTSSVKRVDFFYSKLHGIKKLNAGAFNTKAGFQVNGTAHLRKNPALQNNALGLDAFFNLMGSLKLTKDISRKETRPKKFLFLKYKLSEKRRDLAFRLNAGIFNSTYRNGYAYTRQSAILNNPKLFDGYVFKPFSGFRMQTHLHYTRYLSNKNAVQFSYSWDAYKTSGQLDKFEMANHLFKIVLLFNTNNR